jgi:hypothetical protein
MRNLSWWLLLAACGSEPVKVSEPVGIELDAKSGDTMNGTVTENKDITTESGNPYGQFVNDATAKLGHAPGEIEIGDMAPTLGGQSTGVSDLSQVLTGAVDVSFVVNSTNNTYDAGQIMNPSGIGPDTMDVVFDWKQVPAEDVAQFQTGGFKVVLRGPAAANFATKGADARLQVTFTFEAFE